MKAPAPPEDGTKPVLRYLFLLGDRPLFHIPVGISSRGTRGSLPFKPYALLILQLGYEVNRKVVDAVYRRQCRTVHL